MTSFQLDEEVQRHFRACFGSNGPTAVVRAPGRINLMGEHLDYNGLPVLPMILERGITLAFRPRADDRIRLVNLDPVHAPIDDAFRDRGSLPVRGDWCDFVRVARQSLAQHCSDMRGFDGVLGANLPIAAGLSSSTALVVAVAKALLFVNDIRIDRLALIDCLARGERQVGAPGGAMDQAACIAGTPRTALKVEFDPLQLTSIPLPEGWQFIVAHSLVEADKSGAAEPACRARIAECGTVLSTLRRAGLAGSESYSTLVRAYECEELLAAAAPVLRVNLLRRLRHVLTEFHRVQEAERRLRTQDIAGFGELMYRSHWSLRDDFAVSHPALDRLVELAQANGAVGARLTGAGFGGCIIALCNGSAESLMHAFRRDYYANLTPSGDEGRLVFRA
jgi:galactokinase